MKKRHEYLLRRLGLTVFSLWVVITMLFLLFRLAPGDPSSVLVSPEFSEAEREAIRRQYGLHRPLHIQYIRYMENFLVGNWGKSFLHGSSVLPFVLDRALNTLAITLPAVIMAFLIGPFIGATFAWNRGKSIDTYGTAAVLVAYAAPIFWTGMLAIMVFSFWLNVLPSGRMLPIGHTTEGILDRFLNPHFPKYAILPIVIFFLWRLSQPTLLMRNNMIEVLGSDYIELKEAEGLASWKVQFKHAMRNALLPVVHYGALALGFAFGGSVVLETVFSWPGLGNAMWQAVLSSDYPVAQGAFFLLSFVIISMNYVADVITVYLDPRTVDEAKR